MVLFFAGSGASTGIAAAEARDPVAESLKMLSVEDLMNVAVSTASRIPEKKLQTPAAVYVITREDIRRAGVTGIPEALRLAPGVEVARRSAHAWSIAVRGFNGDLSNELLVLIDGRSVYSPLYAGVFWDVQDTLLEDVDRIEVVAGPGGTLWGANAVNGVINIITRSAGDTRGGFFQAGAGNQERGFTGLRYGGALGDTAAGRVYLKYFDRDASGHVSGGDAADDWRMARGGFRLDGASNGRANRWTLQGDVYKGEKSGQFLEEFMLGTLPAGVADGEVELAGGNLLARWERARGDDAGITLQAYYDHTRRDIPNTYAEFRDTLDLDFQHRLGPRGRHDVLWGAGWRWTRDRLDNTLFATFEPRRRTDRTFSAFVQDRIELWDARLSLTLGSKFEHNDYTGFEYQPSLRLAWLAGERQTLWAAVSRAVRIPSRLDADLRLMAPVAFPGIPVPVYISVTGNHAFDAERLLAYEAGYRIQPFGNLSVDLAAFYNDYEELQTTEPRDIVLVLVPPLPHIILPNTLANGMRGRALGGTVAADWRPLPAWPDWRLQLHYTWLDMKLRNEPWSLDSGSLDVAGNSPEHRVAVRSFVDLPRDVSFYVGARYVDALPNQAVSSYTAVDLSLGWKPRRELELSLTVNNLADEGHVEFASGAGIMIERSVYGTVAWRFP